MGNDIVSCQLNTSPGKRGKGDTPSARTARALRDRGYTVDTVERYNHQTRTRHDFCGFGDLIAFDTRETIVVQATSTPNIQSRIAKVLDSNLARKWLEGCQCRRIQVWGWRRYAKKDSSGRYWRETKRDIGLAAFDE